MENKDFIKGAAVGGILTAAVALGGFTAWSRINLPAKNTVLSRKGTIDKLEYLETLIDAKYMDEKDEEKLEEGLYAGLIYGLGDAYSRYYTAEEYEQESSDNAGSYVGIGVLIMQNSEGGILITKCYEGGPADLAGIKEGDVISSVDGTDITEMTIEEVSDMIRNDEDRSAVLTVHREDVKEPFDVTVSVSDVELPAVFHEMLEDNIGYLRISEFTMVAPGQFEEALSDLKEQGMEKLVVDLRYNPGGILTSVCDVLRQILPEGLIVYMEDKYGNRREETCDGETPLDIPLAVIVNGESASASEVFAGAVQDYGIGTIVGTTTYGKGVVQSLYKLKDGSAVKLTTEKYYTPNGRSIHEVGIEPDVEVKLDTSLLNKEEITYKDDNQLQAAIKVLEDK